MEKSDNLINQILDNGPSLRTVLLLLNEIKSEGRNDEALQECLKAIKTYPDDIYLQCFLAECYLEKGFINRAEVELDKISGKLEELARIHKLQVDLFIEQEKFQEASSCLHKYLAYHPEDKEAIALLSSIPAAPMQKIDKVSGADETIDTARSDLATPTLAEIYFTQGKVKHAITAYESILSKNPDDQASMERLVQLKNILAKEKLAFISSNQLKKKGQKLIIILEEWLTRIREFNHA